MGEFSLGQTDRRSRGAFLARAARSHRAQAAGAQRAETKLSPGECRKPPGRPALQPCRTHQKDLGGPAHSHCACSRSSSPAAASARSAPSRAAAAAPPGGSEADAARAAAVAASAATAASRPFRRGAQGGLKRAGALARTLLVPRDAVYCSLLYMARPACRSGKVGCAVKAHASRRATSPAPTFELSLGRRDARLQLGRAPPHGLDLRPPRLQPPQRPARGAPQRHLLGGGRARARLDGRAAVVRGGRVGLCLDGLNQRGSVAADGCELRLATRRVGGWVRAGAV